MAEEVASFFGRLGLLTDKKAWNEGDRLISGIKGALISLGVIGGVSWAKGLVDNTIEAASAVVDMSAKLGVTAESLQELGYAASLSGSSLGGIETGLRILSRNMQNAKEGSKELKKAFREVGVTFKGANGELRPSEDVLMDIAGRLSKMPDGAKKTALAMKLLGRSGSDLIPLLNEGKDGIEAMRQEARELGLVIDNETAASMEAFGDDTDRLKANFTGIRNQLVTALLPHLRKLVTTVLNWIKANRALIKQNIKRFVEGVTAAAQALWTAFTAVTKAVKWLWENTTLLQAGLIALGAVYTVLAAKALYAWVVQAAPLLFLIAGLTALYLIVEDLWVAFNGGESVFKNLYMAAKTWLADKFGEIVEYFEKKLEDAERALFGSSVREQRRLLRQKQEELAIARIKVSSAKARLDAQAQVTRDEVNRDAVDTIKRMSQMTIDLAVQAKTDPLTQAVNSYGPGGLPPQFNPSINVTVPPGTDANGVGEAVKNAMQDFFDSMIRDAADVTGGGQ